MDLIMGVVKNSATGASENPQALAGNQASARDFSSLMNAKRGMEGLAGNPVIQAAVNMSETHRDNLTNRLVTSFEKNMKVRNSTERYVGTMEDIDAVMTQKSRMSMMEIVTKSAIKNIETLTTKMS